MQIRSGQLSVRLLELLTSAGQTIPVEGSVKPHIVWTCVFAGYQNLLKQQLKLLGIFFCVLQCQSKYGKALTGNCKMALIAPNLPCSLLFFFVK